MSTRIMSTVRMNYKRQLLKHCPLRMNSLKIYRRLKAQEFHQLWGSHYRHRLQLLSRICCLDQNRKSSPRHKTSYRCPWSHTFLPETMNQLFSKVPPAATHHRNDPCRKWKTCWCSRSALGWGLGSWVSYREGGRWDLWGVLKGMGIKRQDHRIQAPSPSPPKPPCPSKKKASSSSKSRKAASMEALQLILWAPRASSRSLPMAANRTRTSWVGPSSWRRRGGRICASTIWRIGRSF